MAKSSETEGVNNGKAPRGETTRLQHIIRDPSVWAVGAIVTGIMASMGYVAHEVVTTQERTDDIKAAARAWANGKPNAFKNLSRVSMSELQGEDGVPWTIAGNIIGGDFATKKDHAAFWCATAAMNAHGQDGFTPQEMDVIRQGIQATSTQPEAEAALTVCGPKITGKDTITFPVGKRGEYATDAWLNNAPKTNYIYIHP